MNTVLYVAYHEAGHAVAAAVLGQSIQRIGIARDPKNGGTTGQGYCDWLSTPGFTADELLQTKLTVTSAALVATDMAKLKAEDQTTENLSGTAVLRDHLNEMCKVYGEFHPNYDGFDDMYLTAWKNAAILVSRHFPVVMALAKELIAKDEISGEEAHAIIQASLGQSR